MKKFIVASFLSLAMFSTAQAEISELCKNYAIMVLDAATKRDSGWTLDQYKVWVYEKYGQYRTSKQMIDLGTSVFNTPDASPEVLVLVTVQNCEKWIVENE